LRFSRSRQLRSASSWLRLRKTGGAGQLSDADPIANPELVEHVLEVKSDSSFAYPQALADLLVAQPSFEQTDNLTLARRKEAVRAPLLAGQR